MNSVLFIPFYKGNPTGDSRYFCHCSSYFHASEPERHDRTKPHNARSDSCLAPSTTSFPPILFPVWKIKGLRRQASWPVPTLQRTFTGTGELLRTTGCKRASMTIRLIGCCSACPSGSACHVQKCNNYSIFSHWLKNGVEGYQWRESFGDYMVFGLLAAGTGRWLVGQKKESGAGMIWPSNIMQFASKDTIIIQPV